MPIETATEWQNVAVYAIAAALGLILLQKIPFVGRIVRFGVSLGILAFALFLLIQQAPFEPHLARVAGSLGLDRQQEVVGREVRIRMAGDGHFWADVTLNGVRRRMLVDSGATVTALSEATAASAGVDRDENLVPVMLRTANGVTAARTGSVKELRLGTARVTGLKVVVSPALGDMDILGMNFLSKLASWRVEGRTLVMVPHHPVTAS
jgi:aspartyl protease family protein